MYEDKIQSRVPCLTVAIIRPSPRGLLKPVGAKIDVTVVDTVIAGAGRFGVIIRVRYKGVGRATRAFGA